MSRIVMTGASVAFEQKLRVAGVNGELGRSTDDLASMDPERAAQVVAPNGTDVVSIGPDVPIAVSLGFAAALDKARPEISVILIAKASPELWEPALRAGVRDLLRPDADDETIRLAFERALETSDKRRRNLAATQEPGGKNGRIVTIISPKGGVGKTVMATNLAVGLVKLEPESVVLVDLDLQFGDVRSALVLTPDHSILDATKQVHGIDTTTLKVFLARHPSGLYALCGPTTPAQGEEVDAAAAARVVEALAGEFPYTIIDTSAGLSEHTLAAIELSTDLVIVADMDVPSVKAVRAELDALDELGMTTATRHLVVNRADSRVGLAVRDIVNTVGMNVDVKIPSSRLVPLSVNQGSPVLEANPGTPVGKHLRELVARFADSRVRQNGSRRWRRRG